MGDMAKCPFLPFFLFFFCCLLLLLFSFKPCILKTVRGTVLKLCTQVGSDNHKRLHVLMAQCALVCSNVGKQCSLCANNKNITINICRQCTFHVYNSILNQHTLQCENIYRESCLFIEITIQLCLIPILGAKPPLLLYTW